MKKRAVTGSPNIVEYTTEEVVPVWTKTSKIRNKRTGQMVTVITIFPHATLIADQNEMSLGFVLGKIILERDYELWACDSDMVNKDPVNFEGDWKFHHVSM
jgi:hypothetical protein